MLWWVLLNFKRVNWCDVFQMCYLVSVLNGFVLDFCCVNFRVFKVVIVIVLFGMFGLVIRRFRFWLINLVLMFLVVNFLWWYSVVRKLVLVMYFVIFVVFRVVSNLLSVVLWVGLCVIILVIMGLQKGEILLLVCMLLLICVVFLGKIRCFSVLMVGRKFFGVFFV